MKRKKITALTAFLLAGAMTIVGCGGGASNAAKESTTESATESTAETTETGGEDTKAEGAGDENTTSGTAVKVADLKVTADDSTSSKDTLIIAMPSDPGTVDMHYSTAYDYVQPFVISHLMNQAYNENGTILPTIEDTSLAESYEYDKDNLGITFKIRQGVKFHNGTELTAKDVVFSINLCSDQSYYNMIDFANVKAVDDSTVYVKLLKVDANALYNIGVMLPIYSEAYYKELNDEGEFFSTSAIGTGPYKIVEWVSGDYLKLEANEDYYAGAPKIKNLTLRFMTDSSVAFMEMQNGGVDIIQSPNWSDVEEVLNGNVTGITPWTEASAYTLQLGMNCSGALKDLKLRQAIACALDKQVIVDGGYQGSGVNTYCLVSKSLPGTIDYQDSWPYKYDPDRAKELLKEAGYDAGKLELTCIVGAGDALRTATAEIMGGYLEEIGIKLNIKEVDIATYASTVADNPDQWDFFLRNFSSGLGNAPSAHDYFAQNVEQNCHIDDQDTAAKMLELAASMGSKIDETERNEVYKELQDYYLNDCLYTFPLLQAETYTLVSSELANISKCGQINWNIKDAYFK